MAFCSKCATQVQDSEQFCPNCGQAIIADPEQQQQQQHQPQQQYQEPQQPLYTPQQPQYQQPQEPQEPQYQQYQEQPQQEPQQPLYTPQQPQYQQPQEPQEPQYQQYQEQPQQEPQQPQYQQPYQQYPPQQQYQPQPQPQQQPQPQYPPQQQYQQQYQPQQQQYQQQPQYPPQQQYQQQYQRPQQGYYPPVMPGAPQQADAYDIDNNKAMAILAYIIFFIPLLVGAHKTSPYAKFHTNQGTVLFLCNLGWSIVYGILTAIFAAMLFSGAFRVASVIITLLGILWLVPLAFVVLGIINAATGKMKPLPVIGNISILK